MFIQCIQSVRNSVAGVYDAMSIIMQPQMSFYEGSMRESMYCMNILCSHQSVTLVQNFPQN